MVAELERQGFLQTRSNSGEYVVVRDKKKIGEARASYIDPFANISGYVSTETQLTHWEPPTNGMLPCVGQSISLAVILDPFPMLIATSISWPRIRKPFKTGWTR